MSSQSQKRKKKCVDINKSIMPSTDLIHQQLTFNLYSLALNKEFFLKYTEITCMAAFDWPEHFPTKKQNVKSKARKSIRPPEYNLVFIYLLSSGKLVFGCMIVIDYVIVDYAHMPLNTFARRMWKNSLKPARQRQQKHQTKVIIDSLSCQTYCQSVFVLFIAIARILNAW